MAGKGMHILYHNGFLLLPAMATDASSFFYPGAGHGSLKGTQHQLVFFYEVKPDPKPSKLFFKCGAGIGHIGDKVGLSFEQALNLWEQMPVLLCLGSLNYF
jgi:hypothetical protein